MRNSQKLTYMSAPPKMRSDIQGLMAGSTDHTGSPMLTQSDPWTRPASTKPMKKNVNPIV